MRHIAALFIVKTSAGVDEKTDYSCTLECWAGPCASGHRRSWRLCRRSVRQRQDLPYYSITGSSITNIWLSRGGMYCTILGYAISGQTTNAARDAKDLGGDGNYGHQTVQS